MLVVFNIHLKIIIFSTTNSPQYCTLSSLFFQENGLHTDLLPLLVFLGLGALTDFSPVISNPKTLLLGAAAQAGVFVALIGTLLLNPIFDFGLLEASSVGIIGGADGPTTIFIASRMKELGNSLGVGVQDIVGATAVAAYSYMALVPLIQPPIIKFFTTKKERQISNSKITTM